MKKLLLLGCLGAALLCAGAARADAPDQLFADANAAYLSGDVARAAAAYQALVSEGIESPALETNLGAACLRQGKRGLAALHFERALFLDPGDDDARADAAELRRGNVDKLEGENEEGGGDALRRMLALLPGGSAAVLLVLFWAAGWALLGVRAVRPRLPLGWSAALCFALAVAAGAVTFAAAQGQTLALQRAVVVSPSVPAREGPSPSSASHFEVHEGTVVRVEDEADEYRRVQLSNGLTGWVPASSLELVVPPGWAGRPVLARPGHAAL